MQPLVTRPAYGQATLAESGLPKGEPGGKGLSLDKDIPGTRTFDKPVNDVRDFDKAEPGSIYRKDGPDNRAKKQDDPEGDRRQNDWLQPTYAVPGGRPKDDYGITKYPYRDDRPNRHNASVEFVLGRYLAANAHDALVSLDSPARIASTIADVEKSLSNKVTERSLSCTTTLKRVDAKNLRWIFSVNCGNGPKVVKMKATRRSPRVVQLSLMDVKFSCSCPAWQWLGPEHNAQQGQYLDGKPRGTASPPDIKDPPRKNKVCKHVASVLALVRTWNLGAANQTTTKPSTKKPEKTQPTVKPVKAPTQKQPKVDTRKPMRNTDWVVTDEEFEPSKVAKRYSRALQKIGVGTRIEVVRSVADIPKGGGYRIYTVLEITPRQGDRVRAAFTLQVPENKQAFGKAQIDAPYGAITVPSGTPDQVIEELMAETVAKFKRS
jgi:hypothetical protein